MAILLFVLGMSNIKSNEFRREKEITKSNKSMRERVHQLTVSHKLATLYDGLMEYINEKKRFLMRNC